MKQRSLARLLADEEGATAVEYGLILAGVAFVIITVVVVMGRKANNKFTAVSNAHP